MQKSYLKTLLQIAISIFAIITAISCATPQTEYRYITIKPREIEIPKLDDYVNSGALKKSLSLIEKPETATDLLINLSEYRNAYVVWRTYGIELEKYISDVKRIIDAYNKEISDE